MQNLRENFLKDGYVVIKNFFNNEQINELRKYSLENANKDNEIFEYDFIKKYFLKLSFLIFLKKF